MREGSWSHIRELFRCFICGKLKGQPPDRCPGHYEIPARKRGATGAFEKPKRAPNV